MWKKIAWRTRHAHIGARVAALISDSAPNAKRIVLAGLLTVLSQSGVGGAPPGAADNQSVKKGPAAAEVKVEIASFAQIQGAIAKYKGKVVVVDYWSSWCPPCIKELPELVQLHKELGTQIVCLTVDVDFAGIEGEKPEEHRENVLGILTKNQVTTRNFISSDPDMTVFKKLSVSTVPALQVFDRAGKLHTSFSNDNDKFGEAGFSILKHVKPVVVELMK